MNDEELDRAISRALFAHALKEAGKPAIQLSTEHVREMLAAAEQSRRIRLPPIPGVDPSLAPGEIRAAARNAKRTLSDIVDKEARAREDKADANDNV